MTPLAAIVPFVDPGARDAAKEDGASSCAELVRHQRQDRGGDAGAEERAGAAAADAGERRQRRALSGSRGEPAAQLLRLSLTSLPSPFECDLPVSSACCICSASSVEPGAASRAAGSTLPDSANSRAALS